jgi:hypothetical protein
MPGVATAWGEHGERELVSEGLDGGELLGAVMAKGEISLDLAADILETVQEWQLLNGPGVRQASVREEVARLTDLLERGFLNLRRYRRKHGDADLAERCLWLLLKFHTLAGASNMTELAGVMTQLTGRPYSKQTVNKCLQFFQREMPELPLLEGQRPAEARENMAAARVARVGAGKKSEDRI